MTNDLRRLPPVRKTGKKPFRGVPGGVTLHDFWEWAYSDLVTNTNRGVLAEYLVAHALGADQDVRQTWRPYDIETPGGVKVEVKSAAYLQAWGQPKGLSRISFGVAPTHAEDPDTALFAKEAKRQAEVYVFALLKHEDKQTLDPMDVSQWVFYVLPTNRLGAERTLRLERLRKLAPEEVRLENLRDAVAAAHRSPSAT